MIRGPEFSIKFLDTELRILIEGGGRLIEQQDFRSIGQCARQRNSLLLAAGEDRHLPRSKSRQSYMFEQSRNLFVGQELAALRRPKAQI